MRALLIALFLFANLFGAHSADKNDASPEGLEEALAAVRQFKASLKLKEPKELIALFIPSGHRRYGGYDYYYNYKANIAIREELESRGKSAESALRANATNRTRIWEAINGPGDTIGSVCTSLLRNLAQ